LNIDIVNLANHHIYDFGKSSYELTKEILKQNNIDYFGIEDKEVTHTFEENKIALNGYCCYSTNPMGIQPPLKKGVNELNYSEVEQRLSDNTTKGTFNIISFHIGEEHVNFPNYDHIEMGRKLAKVGSYIFYGHHPHVAQGLEEVDGSLLAYSLGNFCFDDVYTSKSEEPLIRQSENNKQSFILELEVESNTLVGHKVIPIFIGENRMIVGDLLIKDKIEAYSKALLLDKDKLIAARKVILDDYISSRKTMRNIKWYLKRLNHRSFFLILEGRKNAKKYYTALKQFL
jgi:hypothetical protein